MSTLPADWVASGRGTLVDRETLAHLAVGTLVTANLAAARDRYERFFGLECIEYAAGRMVVRDRRSKHLMERDSRDFFLLDVTQVPEIERPQALFNHWGFSVKDEAEVDRIRDIAVNGSAEFGLKKIHPTTKLHGSYTFYMTDVDDNWWEIEFRRGVTNDLMFSKGDWNAAGREAFPIVDPQLLIAAIPAEVVGDETFLTHGTTVVIDTDRSRGFYEQVLGLRSVHHARVAHCFAGSGDFAVVGLNGGDKIQDQGPENRFVLLVEDESALDAFHARVRRVAEEFGLLSLTDIRPGEFAGRYFLLRTADRIWFEISSRSRQSYVDWFGKRR